MSALLETPTTLAVNGETIQLTPFKFGQLPRVATALAALAARAPADGQKLSLPALLALGGEDILEVAAVAAGKPRAWFDTLSIEDGLALVGAVIAVNQEQFAKKILPALATLTATVAGAVKR